MSKESIQASETADRDRRARESEIVKLAARYEAVRDVPGRDRESAYNALALALKRHGTAVLCGGRWWRYSKGTGELASEPAERTWQAPEDRHADPRRVAWDAMVGPGRDLVEIQ